MSDFWVFGYGSLMWKPGFPYREFVSAHLPGAHRALCVYSWVHRGTKDRPGLVLGLDRGGSCRGVAYRVDGERRKEVVAYLRERELVTEVYRQVWRNIRLDRPDAPTVEALTYIVDRSHVQYAGALDRETILEFVRGARGRSGENVEYVLNTVGHIRDLGFRDPILEWIADRLSAEGGVRPRD